MLSGISISFRDFIDLEQMNETNMDKAKSYYNTKFFRVSERENKLSLAVY